MKAPMSVKLTKLLLAAAALIFFGLTMIAWNVDLNLLSLKFWGGLLALAVSDACWTLHREVQG